MNDIDKLLAHVLLEGNRMHNASTLIKLLIWIRIVFLFNNNRWIYNSKFICYCS